ncbi:MAG: hypothetical protein H0T73_16860 [Ardenticatenales bacterium]|nr:hypothetical protein [Ardenticatenales bacterium]
MSLVTLRRYLLALTTSCILLLLSLLLHPLIPTAAAQTTPTLQVALSPSSPAAQSVQAGAEHHRFTDIVVTAGSGGAVELTSLRVRALSEQAYVYPHEALRNVRVVNRATNTALGTLSTLSYHDGGWWWPSATGQILFDTPLTLQPSEVITLSLEADVAWATMGTRPYRLGVAEATSLQARAAGGTAPVAVQLVANAHNGV